MSEHQRCGHNLPVDDFCEKCSHTELLEANVALADEVQRLRSRVAELEEALRDLVRVNEGWNEAVGRIVGRPPGWSDAYLDRARRLLGMEVEP